MCHPISNSPAATIPIEVKTKKAQPDDLPQLRGYMSELRGECSTGVLIEADFHKQVVADAEGRRHKAGSLCNGCKFGANTKFRGNLQRFDSRARQYVVLRILSGAATFGRRGQR